MEMYGGYIFHIQIRKKSWSRIDRIVRLTEWNMDCRIGELSQRDFIKIIQLVEEIMTNNIAYNS